MSRPDSAFASDRAAVRPPRTARVRRSVLVAMIALLVMACGQDAEAPEQVENRSAEDLAELPNFQPIGGIKLTMGVVLEPAAEKVWDSAGFIITKDNVENLAPTTEEAWAEVRHGAAVVAEAGNLLMMSGRTMPGPEWMQISRSLTEAGKRAMAAAEAQDEEALFNVGGEIYAVCVSCHQRYWPDGSSRVGNSADLVSTQPPLDR